MENIIVGLIVAAALAFSVRSFIRIYRGKGGCSCGDGCGCSTSEKSCCGQHHTGIHKQP